MWGDNLTVVLICISPMISDIEHLFMYLLAIWLYIYSPKTQEFIYKKLCIYSYMFKLQLPSKYPPFDAIHLWRCFFHCSKQFVSFLILMPFSVSAIFLFHSSTLTKCLPLRTFFIWENKKSQLGWDQVNREGGAWSLLNTKQGVGWCTRESPIMKWANTLKTSSKKFTEAECSLSQQLQLVHWYRWEPSGGSLYYKEPALQKIIPVFLWSPLYIILNI